ncbi:unnamed protein product [Dicrocoelium dendriticum]|nr:unnamed protein product [Dicrocoelium dendriticum]
MRICAIVPTDTLGIFLVFALFTSPGHTRKLTAPWMEERLFLRARCKTKCLRVFQNSQEQHTFKHTWHELSFTPATLEDCFSEGSEQCSSKCFTACDQPPDQCVSTCSAFDVGCHLGCAFLLESVDPHPGKCPSREDVPIAWDQYEPRLRIANTGDGKCLSSCQSDRDCVNLIDKCCTVGCQRICSTPLFNESTPPLPAALKPFESKLSPMIVELNWSVPYSQLNAHHGPIVFILQTRICVCKHLDLSHVTGWQTLIMTHQFGAKLDAFEPGRMYQFRIAAVSPFGTRGFGPPSDPYPLHPVRPNPPSPPRNVTDSIWRFYSTGTIHVLLNWEPPEHSELTITEYSIKWVIDHGYVQPGGQSLEGLTQFAQSIPADKAQYVIQDLKPSKSYKVQVRAVAFWIGYGPLESQPNTIFLSTHTIPPVFTPQTFGEQGMVAATTMLQDQQSSNASNCECHTDSLTTKLLQLKRMFYDKEELIATFVFNPPVAGANYILEWAPQVCINPSETEPVSLRQTLKVRGKARLVSLGHLRFSCRYTIRIKQLTHEESEHRSSQWSITHNAPRRRKHDEVATTYHCFCTPSCLDMESNAGTSPVNCSLPDPGPPPAPLDLITKEIGQLRYRISWEPPIFTERWIRAAKGKLTKSGVSLLQNIKYRVVWAPRIEEPVSREMYNDAVGFSPLMDLQRSDARIVHKNQTWLDLHNLSEDTFYIVRVQTLLSAEPSGFERESSPTALYFITPKVKAVSPHSAELGSQTQRSTAAARSLYLYSLPPIKNLPSLSTWFLIFRILMQWNPFDLTI